MAGKHQRNSAAQHQPDDFLGFHVSNGTAVKLRRGFVSILTVVLGIMGYGQIEGQSEQGTLSQVITEQCHQENELRAVLRELILLARDPRDPLDRQFTGRALILLANRKCERGF